MEFKIPGSQPAETTDQTTQNGIVADANQGLAALASQIDEETKSGEAGTDVINQTTESFDHSLADLDDGPGFEGEPVREDYIEVSYKHRSIAHFKVGPFIFKNHVLVIGGTTRDVLAKVEQFKDLWRGLGPQDKLNIKRLKNIQNEANVDDDLTPRAVRGAVDTAGIADRQLGDRLTPQTPKPGQKTGFAARSLPFQNIGR
jgi:hypothetical protein